VPEELRRLKNLNALDLGRNKLRALPAWMNELQYMQEFSAGRNKFMEVPETVCQWKALKRLDLHQNEHPRLASLHGRPQRTPLTGPLEQRTGRFPGRDQPA
jgi:Leucine-rich repeat (LRR) protein